MDELRVASHPSLRRPVLITAFRGWNDGGQGASLAAGFLARTWSAARFADIDPDSGGLAMPNCPKIRHEAFLPGSVPMVGCSLHNSGSIY